MESGFFEATVTDVFMPETRTEDRCDLERGESFG